MGALKDVNVKNALADVEECLTSLPETGETITANIQARIDKAKKALAHLKKALSSSSTSSDPRCGKRPSVRPEG